MEKCDKLVENIIHLKCIKKEEGIGFECISQCPVKDPSLQTMVFPFCFPEGDAIIEKKDNLVHAELQMNESFAFILTDINAERRYVYCRRFTHHKFLECFCIVTDKPFESLYSKILDKAIIIRKISLALLGKFFEDITKQPVPATNGIVTNINFRQIPYEIVSEENTRKRHSFNVKNLLNLFGASFLVDIIGNIMTERKFIFLGESISLISDTIIALTSLLHPFVWHHVLVPILPLQLSSYPTAPMPYLIGVQKNLWGSVKQECEGGMDDTIVIDIDKGYQVEGYDYSPVFNSDSANILRSQLSLLQKSEEEFDNEEVYEIFRVFFYKIFHNYFDFFIRNSDQKIVFDKEAFCAQLNVYDQEFFKKFEESQMCFMFFNMRAKQKAENNKIEELCPFALPPKRPEAEVLGCFTLMTEVADVESDQPFSMACRYCFMPIGGNEPCSLLQPNKLYHINCFRCICCGRILEGDVLPDPTQLVCMYCHLLEREEMDKLDLDYVIKRDQKMTKNERKVAKCLKKKFKRETLKEKKEKEKEKIKEKEEEKQKEKQKEKEKSNSSDSNNNSCSNNTSGMS
ncbi:denn domain containing protein, putative [Entamoeba invadens IP1]|uniref:Denn domain containing protein, putative n=1 Tax=Entamoeba invadens IP1 TaxID=370355 RepID=A0A0A1U2Y5_ENTIV|nr:denn domain containing protein, putative [Entamoeba invadens IP1]ELP88412.1 denn domain containing protein, putative [Entamoeba invadens IP1]|eukprot:XP_004255183.1 denn domain containing protein, putative [Entamoeba invadens IP1]